MPSAASRGSGPSDHADAEGDRGGKAASIAEYRKARRRELEAVLAKLAEDSANASAIVREFAMTWLPSHLVEAEVLVPALEDAGVDDEKMGAVKVRKDILNLLLADLLQPTAVPFAQAKLEALADAFDAVARASDREHENLAENVESQGMSALGSQMNARYERVKARFANLDQTIGEAMDILAPRSLSVAPTRQQRRRENSMTRYSDRDEQGRFLPEDERDHAGSRRGGPERDDEGRFVSEGGRHSRGRYDDEGGRQSRGRYEDDEERFGRRSMGRERDDDGRYSSRSSGERGRGHGGWFGDSEGHSEASRRGWQSGQHRESGWFGDPEGHSEASRRGWRSGGHGESGWFGDSEGHSEASRRGWRSGDHGESGWRGDPEGHSEAARRGWEYGHRGQQYDEDDRRGGSESRRNGGRYEDEDDRGSSRGRSGGRSGHGGWSGDPDGHSEAARRGWEHRR